MWRAPNLETLHYDWLANGYIFPDVTITRKDQDSFFFCIRNRLVLPSMVAISFEKSTERKLYVVSGEKIIPILWSMVQYNEFSYNCEEDKLELMESHNPRTHIRLCDIYCDEAWEKGSSTLYDRRMVNIARHLRSSFLDTYISVSRVFVKDQEEAAQYQKSLQQLSLI